MRRGIFIGVSEYDDPEISGLGFASRDAGLVARTLYDKCGFDPSGSAVLTARKMVTAGDTREPDSENIHLAFERQKQLGPCEAFIFYFSGHGFRGRNGTDYLVPRRARQDALEATSLPLSRLVSACLEIDAKTTLVVMDACRVNFAGHSLFGALADDATLALRGRNLVLLYSAQPGHLSYEASALEAGVFSSVFTRLLSPAFKCKSLGQIHEALRREVPKASLEAGKPHQLPYVTFFPETSRDWVLPISKLTQRLAMPEWLGEEIRDDRTAEDPIRAGVTLALDFGTTKTVGAYWEDDSLKYVQNHGGGRIKHSTIEFEQSGDYRVGQPPFGRNLIAYAKRRIIDRKAYTFDERLLSPMQAASLIIESLVQDFEAQTQASRGDCIAAVPCDYSIVDAELLVQALQGNGLSVRQVIREPTAAAFNLLELVKHEEHEDCELTAVVIDMGGGTLDVSVVCVNALTHAGATRFSLRVLASCGDRRLGGIDFNALLHEHVLRRSGLDEDSDRLIDPHALAVRIEEAKLALSRGDNPTIMVELLDDAGEQVSLPVHLTQRDFRRISVSLVRLAMQCIDNCIERAVIWGHEHCQGVKLNPNGPSELEPDVVLIAGQSGQIPAIRQVIGRRFPKAALVDKHSECAVVRGLAIASKLDCEIIDVTYFSIGVIGINLGNQIVLPLSDQPRWRDKTVWLILAEDEAPTSRTKGLFVDKGGQARITVVSATSAGRVEEIATVEVNLDRYRGNIAKISLVIDTAMTVVVEIADDRRQSEARQINNFYRLPHGFAAIDPITLVNQQEAFAGGREVQRAVAPR